MKPKFNQTKLMKTKLNVKTCFNFVLNLNDFVMILLRFCYDFVWPKKKNIFENDFVYQNKTKLQILTKITETKQKQKQNADA